MTSAAGADRDREGLTVGLQPTRLPWTRTDAILHIAVGLLVAPKVRCGSTPAVRSGSREWLITAPWAALSPLQQCAHIRDRIGIAFQAVHIVFGLQFNLKSDAVRIMKVEGLAISPFDNVGHGAPLVLEPLVGSVKFFRRVHR